MGIVHHGAYAAYLEEARAAFLAAAGHPYGKVREEGVDFTVLELSVCYRRPLTFGDEVEVGLRVGALTRTTFQVGYLLTVLGEVRSDGSSVHAAVNPRGRPVRMPAWMGDVVAYRG